MGRARYPREYGTMRGFSQHHYYLEQPCGACAAVRRADKQAKQYRQRNAGKCAKGLGWPLEARRDG